MMAFANLSIWKGENFAGKDAEWPRTRNARGSAGGHSREPLVYNACGLM